MGLFKTVKPRAFNHQYIYVDENAKRDLGMLPPKESTAEERICGKFVEGTKHLKRRKESGRKPLTLGALLIALAVLCYVLHYLVTGELTF